MRFTLEMFFQALRRPSSPSRLLQSARSPTAQLTLYSSPGIRPLHTFPPTYRRPSTPRERALENAPFRHLAATRRVLVRPRGFSPPRRFTPVSGPPLSQGAVRRFTAFRLHQRPSKKSPGASLQLSWRRLPDLPETSKRLPAARLVPFEEPTSSAAGIASPRPVALLPFSPLDCVRAVARALACQAAPTSRLYSTDEATR
jgi:hypothetical protein